MGCEHIYLWQDPVVTAPIFASVLIVLVSISYYSLISVASYTALFVVGTVAGIKLYVYVANAVLKKNVNDPVQKCAGMINFASMPLLIATSANVDILPFPAFDPTIPEESITAAAGKACGKINCAIRELRRLFLIENLVESVKFGIALWFMTYVGNCFNAMTLVILAWVGLFTIPKVKLILGPTGRFSRVAFLTRTYYVSYRSI